MFVSAFVCAPVLSHVAVFLSVFCGPVRFVFSHHTASIHLLRLCFFLLLDWRKGGKQRKQSKQSRRYEWAGNFIIQMQKHIWIWMQVIMTDTKTDRQTGRPTDKQTYWQADRLTEWLTGRSSLRDCPSFVFQFYCPVWWIQIKWIYCCIHSVLPSFFRSMLPSPCPFPQRIHFLLLFSPHSFHFVCIKEKPLSAKTKEKPLSRAMRLVLRSSRFASPRLVLAWVCFVLFYAVCHAFSFVLLCSSSPAS